MRTLKAFLSFAGSRTLTLWLVGGFIVYYLSVAVWSREAFSSYVTGLSGNIVFKGVYLLFLLNVTIRTGGAALALRGDIVRLCLRLPLYAGVLLFLVTTFLSLQLRKSSWLVTGEGDLVGVPWENLQYRVVHIESALEKNALRTDDSLIFSNEPAVTLMGEDRISHTVGAFPPSRIRSTYMHVLNFGIGPGIELKRGSEVLAQGDVALRLTPFGAVDNFELPPYPYKFYVSILPSRTVKKGRETAREYDLARPLYKVEVAKGDKTIALVETDSESSFDGDMSLRFLSTSNWVLLDITYDPTYPWYVACLVLLLAGAVLYPFSYRGRKAKQE